MGNNLAIFIAQLRKEVATVPYRGPVTENSQTGRWFKYLVGGQQPWRRFEDDID